MWTESAKHCPVSEHKVFESFKWFFKDTGAVYVYLGKSGGDGRMKQRRSKNRSSKSNVMGMRIKTQTRTTEHFSQPLSFEEKPSKHSKNITKTFLSSPEEAAA